LRAPAAPGGRFVLVKQKLLSAVPREVILPEGWEAMDPARDGA